MSERPRRGLPAALLAAALGVAAAYQVALPVSIGLGPGLLSARAARDLHAPETGFRWTRESGRLVVPGPGPHRRVLVDVTLSAWRPRGQPLPQVTVTAEGARVMAPAAPRATAVRLEATARRLWSGDIEVVIASPAVQPSASDPRRLGVRVHAVRVAAPSAFSPGLPPLRPVLLSVVLTALAAGIAARMRAAPRIVRAAGLASAGVAALAHLVVRAHAAALLLPAVLAAGAAFALAPLLPRAARTAGGLLRATLRRLALAGRALVPAPALIVAATAVAATCGAHAARPVLDLDLGSGREEPYARGLLAYDAEGIVTFRHAPGGAALDLADLGGGATWRLDVVAAGTGPATVSAGGSSSPLSPRWSAAPLDARPRWGWRRGLLLEFGGAGAALRLDRVRIDRGRSLPSPRVALAVAAAGVLMALAFAAAGCGRACGLAAGLATVAAAAAALAGDPLLATPLAARFAALVALGALLAAAGAAVNERTGGALPGAAVAACAAGFVLWLAAPLTPLYRGGHFIFHSSIAEEIWQGRLLHYALPYPGSMLSQQAQWGNVVVPHPCLFHVVAAPLAALPRPWFYAAVKGLLALWLAAMAGAAALVARRLGGPRAAVYAAVAVVATPATFQLIGLGHLMTVFGCFAMAVAMAFVALRFERMPERGTFWGAAALLTVCYLSYTAALLFTGVLLALALPLLYRRAPEATRATALAAAAAGAAAFVIYYVYWAWPFVTESLPRLLHAPPAAAGGEERALWPRLLAQPRKLAYTFGTPLVPLAGMAGLALAARARSAAAVLMLAWAALLPLFIGTDLFFNFLLKHHYFAVVPVAAGIGVLLGRLEGRPGGRWAAAAALAVMAVLAARVALDVATGRIP